MGKERLKLRAAEQPRRAVDTYYTGKIWQAMPGCNRTLKTEWLNSLFNQENAFLFVVVVVLFFFSDPSFRKMEKRRENKQKHKTMFS